MHPHSDQEAAVLQSSRYKTRLQVWLSDTPQETDINPAKILEYPDWQQAKGYQGLVSGRISADLENPCINAEWRLALGRDEQSISPYMTGGALVNGRPLFDPGRYIAVYAKCFAPDVAVQLPTGTPRPAPVFHGAGLSVGSTGAITLAWPPHQRDDIGLAVIETDDDAVPSVPSGWAEVTGSPVSVQGIAQAPAFQAIGSFGASAGALPKGWPPHQVGDICLLVVESANEVVTLDVAAGFVQIPDSPQGTGTAGGTTATRLTVFWCRATSTSMATPTVADAGDHIAIYMVTFRGCVETGNPWDVTAGDTGASSTSVSIPGDTTTGPNRLVVAIVANATDSVDPQFSAPVNASLTDLTIRGNANTGSGNGGGLTVITGIKGAAGAYSATTGTLATASVQARISLALKPASGATSEKTRLTVFWRRAESNSEPTIVIGDSGDHQIGQIYAFRGCTTTGNPWDVVDGTGQATEETVVSFNSVTTTVANTLVVFLLSNSTDSTLAQALDWENTNLVGLRKFWDTQTTAGAGGGHSIAGGVKVSAGAIGATSATLRVASVHAKMVIALKPPAPSGGGSESVSFENVPWRPIFVGRIDEADPDADEGVLVLRCRDIMSDVLDRWIKPSPTGSHPIEADVIEHVLDNLLALGFPDLTDSELFRRYSLTTTGDPAMAIPAYQQEPGSTLLAMRQAALLNGWDLRGKWDPDGTDIFQLEYYEPDRELLNPPYVLGPDRYYTLRGLNKSRVEVRNDIDVTPSDPPRTIEHAEDPTSIANYGRRYAGIVEDSQSRIRTQEQAAVLVNAILSDTKEPKIMAQVETNFLPWVEVNDVLTLEANGIQHDEDLTVAVSGYEHTFSEDGEPLTVLNTRDRPAAANKEYRSGQPKMEFADTVRPSGSAPEGSRWKVLA